MKDNLFIAGVFIIFFIVLYCVCSYEPLYSGVVISRRHNPAHMVSDDMIISGPNGIITIIPSSRLVPDKYYLTIEGKTASGKTKRIEKEVGRYEYFYYENGKEIQLNER